MNAPRRPRNSNIDTRAIADAVAKQMAKAYPLPTDDPFREIRDELRRIDGRLNKIEEQSNEHFPLIKSLHALLSVGKGFGKFLAWTIALAAASATAWTAIKAIFQAKTG